MEEPRWVETLKNAPLPEAGRLTERAMTAAHSRPTRRAVVLAVLPLVAAVPAVALLLPRQEKPQVSKIAVMEQKPVALVASLTPQSTPLPSLPTLAESFPAVRPEAAPLADVLTEQVQVHPIQKESKLATSEPRLPVAVASRPPEEPIELPALQPLQRSKTEQVVALQERPAAAGVPPRKLSVLSAKAQPLTDQLNAVAELNTVDPLERKLRFPLDPLPDTPQASVEKAEIMIHADSSQILGNVTLRPVATVRELLVAIFDGKSALLGVLKITVPANMEKVELKPNIVLPRARYYQLGLRPQYKRSNSEEQIVGGYTATRSQIELPGGYRGHGAKIEVPAPVGVSVNGADFYQSNVYKDHFIRFTVVLSKDLIDRLSETANLTLHTAVFNEKGALISVASAPLEYKLGQQHPDLALGLLPEGTSYHYRYAVSQEWK
ncbi:MAG: hypothetical protein QM758_20580 [Armatimonas sp.]